MSDLAGPNANYEAGEERRRQYLNLLAAGKSHKDAQATMDIARSTYLAWRRKYPDFKASVDSLISARQDADPEAWNGTPSSWRKSYLGFDTYWHQAKMDEALESCPPMGVVLVLVPPEHGKTTWVGDTITRLVSHDPFVRITYISEGIGHARKAVRRQKRRLTDFKKHPDLIARFGPFHADDSDEPWTADYFVVDGATHDEQDYTMEARGWKAAIAGTRTDLLIIDDIQSRKSLGLTAEMVTTFQQDFLTRPGKTGKTIIIGTRVGLGDFYQALIDNELVDRVVELPATEAGVVVPCPLGDECDTPDVPHEKPLCPELWDTHSLAKRRKQVGEDVWWRTYQQQPRPAGDSTFTEAMTDRAKNHYRTLGQGLEVCEGVAKRGYGIMSLDPALGGGNALTVWDCDAERMWLLDSSRRFGLAQTEQILTEIAIFAGLYRPRVLVVEAVAFQKGLANDERLRLIAAQFGFRIVPHTTGLNKLDELIGVASMDTAFHVGSFDFPYATVEAKAKVDLLVGELNVWRADVPTRKLRQDLVMSMWFAWLEWMRIRSSLVPREGDSPWKRRTMPNRMSVAAALGRTRILTGGTR